MKLNKDKCCGTCEWWDNSFYDPEDFDSRTGACERFPPVPVYSAVEEDEYIEHTPWTGVLHCCGEWLQNTEGRTKENRYGFDLCEDGDCEDDNGEGYYSLTDYGYALLETQDNPNTCVMKLDGEYYRDGYKRFWCSKCNNHNDIEHKDKPVFCMKCGCSVYGCYGTNGEEV